MPKRSPHPYVVWRDGRPRFSPGPELRLAGHRSHDLKHEDGRWFSMKEAVDWSKEFVAKHGSPQRGRRMLGTNPASGHYERGFIYFLWAGRAIKVGYTRNLFRRVSELQTGIAEDVRMVFAVPGTVGDERRLHRRLKSQHIRGEWFKASQATLLVLRMVLNESDGIKGEH